MQLDMLFIVSCCQTVQTFRARENLWQECSGKRAETRALTVVFFAVQASTSGRDRVPDPVKQRVRRITGRMLESRLSAAFPSTPFPFAVRLNVDVLAADGSETMAALSAASLALADAGVPVRAQVAGLLLLLLSTLLLYMYPQRCRLRSDCCCCCFAVHSAVVPLLALLLTAVLLLLLLLLLLVALLLLLLLLLTAVMLLLLLAVPVMMLEQLRLPDCSAYVLLFQALSCAWCVQCRYCCESATESTCFSYCNCHHVTGMYPER